MPKLRVPGRPEPALRVPPAGSGRFLRTTVREAIYVEGVREEGAVVELDVAEDDLIELILEDDITWLVRYDRLRDDLRWNTTRGDAARADGDVLQLGTTIRVGEPSRGIGGLALKAVRLLGLDLPRSSAQFIAGHLENQLEPGPGLYHCPDPRRLERAAAATALAGDQPALLFLHGTASSTEGSFGGLTGGGSSAAWEHIKRTYGDRIFAFEHHTLTKSPLDNVLDVLDALPKNARLHLVSHSRGGLLGEILARGHEGSTAFSDLDLSVFEQDDRDRQADLAAMRRLNTLFAEKQIRVERFVRVACPAAGTTLASGRLDLCLNVIFNLIKRIPLLQASLIFDFIADLTKAVAKERINPESLPGLEAQMPESPLIRVLNNPNRIQPSELAIISGDVKASGFVRRLLILAADMYYWAKHDLVVNTDAMYGGTPRAMPPRYFFDHAAGVDHFHYFINPRTQQALADGLAGRTGNEHGYQPLLPRHQTRVQEIVGLREASPRSAAPRPVVFVLPGIMGSELAAQEDHVWVNILRLAGGALRRLEIDDPEVEAVGLIGSAYADLVTFLSRTYHVVPFPYDWRRSLNDAGDALAERVRAELKATDQPIRFIAHSMGGLVGRAMIARHPDVWAKMKERAGCRFLMLGTPNGGSHMIPETLVGRNKTLRKLALVDLKNKRKNLLGIVVRYPGLLELLPVEDDKHDYFKRPVWDQLHTHYETGGWVLPSGDELEAARAFHRDVLQPSPIDPDVMGYVAGHAPFTPMGHEIVEDEKGGKRVAFFATQGGDGRVSWATGIPETLTASGKVWYMEAEHGKMAAHLPSFFALRDLLDTGATSRLSQTPPVVRGGVLQRFEMPDFMPEHYPGADELEAAVLGFEPEPAAAEAGPEPVQVTVTHGNLAYARYPVVVGHFRGDGIVSAEKALDYYLDGRLSEHHRIGLYPGEVETAEVFILEAHRPPGAVVFGLGTPGTLTAGDLVRSYAHAAMLFALRWHEREDTQAGRNDPPPRLSTLLIGSGYGGLGLRTSIRAILTGIQQANLRLQADGVNVRPIAGLEFIELYEDRAVSALEVLHEQIGQNNTAGFALEDPELRKVRGGLHAILERREPDWWDTRIQVRGFDAEKQIELPGLIFTALTDRARAEVQSLPTQRLLLDKLIRQAVQHAEWDGPSYNELAQTLFELLIPNDFKPYAADRRNVIWVVDEGSAAYPWELLHDPLRSEGEPLAVRAGMLRQLAVPHYRQRITLSTTRRALVVGEPDLSADAGFAPLPAAKEEAEHVAAQLTGRYEVTSLIETQDDVIIRKLLAYDYQILHLAGHGVFEYALEDGEKVTGMVLGNGTFLTPGIVNQMRQVPDLVFINCCHLGRVAARAEVQVADRHRLAANLGTQLIRQGVRAVVAAGWAVNDAAADTFARTFYEQMLQGTAFGEAVRCARETTFRQYPSYNTWGAYQCYGDPYYTLQTTDGGGGGMALHYVAPMEAVIDLKNLARQAEAASSRDAGWLRQQLQAILDELNEHPAWREHSDVLEALADVYFELDLVSEALQAYEALTRPTSSGCSTGALERLGALQVRLGAKQATEAGASADQIKAGLALTASGRDRLEKLIALDPTNERRLHLGGAYKHLARTLKAERKDPLPVLRSAYEIYREVFEYRLERQQAVDHYPLLNWLMLEAVLNWVDTHTPLAADQVERRRQWLDEAQRAAEAADAENPSFWDYGFRGTRYLFTLLDRNLDPGPADLPLHQIVQQQIEQYGPHIRHYYEQAWRRGGTYQVRRSIAEQFDFLIAMLDLGEETPTTEKRRARQALVVYLETIRDEMLALMAE